MAVAAPFVFSTASGRVHELYRRAKSKDDPNAALVLVPLAAAGLEPDDALIGLESLAEVFDGSTTEQTALGRRVLTHAELGSLPDDKYEATLPSVTWEETAGPPIGALLVCFCPDVERTLDDQIIPLVNLGVSAVPDGNDFVLQPGPFYRG